MEVNEEEKKRPPEGDKSSTKRKMKTASQIELLEKTYAVATYPSESIRAELSVKLGLTDRQLQMWFCHRRLKDRKDTGAKRPRKDSGAAAAATVPASAAAPAGDEVIMPPEPANEFGLKPSLGASPFVQGDARRPLPRMVGAPVPRIGGDLAMIKRYYEPPQSISELRAIAFVESQLGEPLREDGPVLGVEFDPLPPDAFGAPLAMTSQQSQAIRPYDSKMFERPDAKVIKASSFLPSMEHCFVPSSSGGKRKANFSSVPSVHPQAGSRALHEYQFLPEQPSTRAEMYERVSSHLYETAIDAPIGRVSGLSAGVPYHHGNEQLVGGFDYQSQMSGVGLISQPSRQSHVFSPGSAEHETGAHKNSLMSVGAESQFGTHPAIGLENPFVPSNRRVSLDDDSSRIEKKRKSDEAKIAKEVEAHEKRIRKELEKQDVLRRKREEQMRREMEKHDRERRKEEERLLREKQREEERYLREQRREHERRERFLHRQSLRAEKMRQKEELRREKEAARQKAANERATARKIARESMELIEDERLELMELAASRKGLSSIISLDSDTLQHLHSFRELLSEFPTKSVMLKRPFAFRPWTDSEGNVGNLFMVWKFLITFADALEIWPFTLDEFVQAFHDYDPRLLGEIHVALLKSIIKDIEDVARTPSVGIGSNQNSAANPGGGHPQIVEGAYAWGFDIRNWQRFLNPLTWPEILRQFALSAGFGPQLKKRSVTRSYFRDENEGHDGEDIVSILRNGAAAENAFAVMQEKGFSYRRRSRHRLTPGTVKFAAFHVLSLEGDKGLTILEVADRIQRSGLRDLTTSKTPEASIAAALSRDAILFERTAPSTYCVRPAFRKDPADADAILAAARARIQIFQNGFSDSEEVEKDAEDGDDAERDDDSESDGAEDPEVDDLGTPTTPIKEAVLANDIKCPQKIGFVRNVKKDAVHIHSSVGKSLSSFPLESSKDISNSSVTNGQTIDVPANVHEVTYAEQDDTEIDESNPGEPWVQGLMEGEYSDLSVEERLNAIVALIGVAIEGNSIRIILEERLEAANALKKQMWAEAQLDKRRMKEDYMSKLQYASFMATRAETNLTGSAFDGNHSPLPVPENKGIEASSNHAARQELFSDPQNVQNNYNNLCSEKNTSGHEICMQLDSFPPQQHTPAAEKSRSQLKSYIGRRAEELYVYRSLPLGQDRRRNRYWQFATSLSRNDPGSGRIFFESHDGCWRVIDSVEAFDALLASLDTRGIRESHLYSALQKIEASFKETARRNLRLNKSVHSAGAYVKEGEMVRGTDYSMGTDGLGSSVCSLYTDTLDVSNSFNIQIGQTDTEKNDALKRYHDLQKWLWKECFNSSILCALKYGKKRCPELLSTCDICLDSYLSEEKHCPSCHKTFAVTYSLDIKFSEHVMYCDKRKIDPNRNVRALSSSLPTRTQVLKAQLALIEACIPMEALQPFWTDANRKYWGMKLYSSSSVDDLFQLLTLLESAVKRDFLSSNFETTRELLGSSAVDHSLDEDTSLPASVSVLPWVPQTTAAVALRLMDFDACISYMLQQKLESNKDKDAGDFIKLPSRYSVVKNIQELEAAGNLEQTGYEQELWMDPGIGRRGRGGRGRGRGRGRAGRGQRRIVNSRADYGKETSWSRDRSALRSVRRPRTRGRGRKWGRRTVRRRQQPGSNVAEKATVLGGFGNIDHVKQIQEVESPRSSGGEDWGGEEMGRMYAEGDGNSAGMSESDENVQASGDEYEDDPGGLGFANVYDDRLVDESEENDDGDEDEDVEDGNVDGGMEEEDEDGNGGTDDDEEMGMDEDGDEEGNRDEDVEDEDEDEEDEDEDDDEGEGTASLSSGYSD